MGTTNPAGDRQAMEATPARLARVGMECPRCHFRQFIEVAFDRWPLELPAAEEIHKQLAAWMVSRCPDHLTWIASSSKN